MASQPDEMNAIDPARPGGPEVLTLERRPVPRPSEGEVLIRVAAAGVNRPDVLQRRGAYPPPRGAPSIPGLEVAGIVAAVGAEVPAAARFGEGVVKRLFELTGERRHLDTPQDPRQTGGLVVNFGFRLAMIKASSISGPSWPSRGRPPVIA